MQAETETEIDAAAATVARHIPETAGRAAANRKIVPGTATQHTKLAFFRTLRVTYVFLRVISEPILTPLPDVAMHIV